MKNLAPLMSSAKEDWQTPNVILDALRVLWPEGIGLDPCTVADNPTGAAQFYTPADDGLAMPWTTARVYCNPPYKRGKLGIKAWVGRCAAHAPRGGTAEAVALVPARTDTGWFPWDSAHAICFVNGRIKFRGAKYGAPFPSALIYWGPGLSEPVEFADAFCSLGKVVFP